MTPLSDMKTMIELCRRPVALSAATMRPTFRSTEWSVRIWRVRKWRTSVFCGRVRSDRRSNGGLSETFASSKSGVGQPWQRQHTRILANRGSGLGLAWGAYGA